MSNGTRERIFTRLHAALREASSFPETERMPFEALAQQDKIDTLKKRMEAMRAEVHVIEGTWTDKLQEISAARNLKTLAVGPGSAIAETLTGNHSGTPELIPYDSAIEDFKDRLFQMDAAITSTRGGIADIGALILWPDAHEPRLLSLVPPVHIAVLEAERIYNTFSEAIEQEGWQNGMPTNALLISGPSKTADIELTLAFGVHGPKELIVLLTR